MIRSERGYMLYDIFIVFQIIRIDYYKRLSTKLLSTKGYASLYRAFVLTTYTGSRDLSDP